MTAFLTETNATPSFYHSEIGFVNFIKRPSLRLRDAVGNKPISVWTSETRSIGDIMFWKPSHKGWIVVELGCGALVKFPWEAVEYLEQGRHCVELENAVLIDNLPKMVDLGLPSFEF